jgi:hypothetical protein
MTITLVKAACLSILTVTFSLAVNGWPQTNLPVAPALPVTNTLPVNPSVKANISRTNAVQQAGTVGASGLVPETEGTDIVTRKRTAADIQIIQSATAVSP